MTGDESPVDETVIESAFSQEVVAPREASRPGRRPLRPERCLAPGVADATVVRGSRRAVGRALKASVCSRTINTSFVERRHATDRGQNTRKSRRTDRFSKDWEVHESRTYFTSSR